MDVSRPLTVRVNEELVLDAGRWEEIPDREGKLTRRVHPPSKTMFEQVMDYLSSVVQIPNYIPLRIGEEGVAATAVCLRWGSYLAVLADREKPLWTEARHEGISRVEDAEMARINIEASAALEQWIEIMRHEPDRYRHLVWAAAGRHLPMTLRSAKRDRELLHLLGLTQPHIVTRLMSVTPNGRFGQARLDAKEHPSRVLANALINSCWRNGPIEQIHAGLASAFPIRQRRITPSEERTLMRTSSSRLAQGMFAVSALIQEDSQRSWWECVLPFQLARQWLVTPTDWSLEERTRGIRLPGGEPRNFTKA